jgi:hypothetical protein
MNRVAIRPDGDSWHGGCMEGGTGETANGRKELMMARMFWQRCPNCGRLVLARLGGAVDCECAGRPPALSAPQQPLSLGPDSSVPDRAPATTTPPPIVRTPPRPGLLSPEQDAAARKLLSDALPADWTF